MSPVLPAREASWRTLPKGRARTGEWAGVEPYPAGVKSAREQIEPGQRREEVPAVGLSKSQAVELGRQLRARMRGTGWKLHVWQNLGWHYCVRVAKLNVHPSGAVSGSAGESLYHVLFGGDGYGLPVFGTSGWHKDPNVAVRAQLRIAKGVVEELQATVAAALEATGGGK